MVAFHSSLWHTKIQTDPVNEHTWPDITVFDKDKKTALLTDIITLI